MVVIGIFFTILELLNVQYHIELTLYILTTYFKESLGLNKLNGLLSNCKLVIYKKLRNLKAISNFNDSKSQHHCSLLY